MSRHFLLVESNTTGTGEITVRALLRAGHRVTFLTRSPAKYRFLAGDRPGLRVQVLETNDVALVTEAVRALRRRQPVDVLLTFSDFYVVIVAEVAAACGLPYLDPAVARTCRNKHAVRQALHADGLPGPTFRLLTSEREAAATAASLPYPCVAKPPEDSASHGVRLVRDPAELLSHFRLVNAWTENVRGQQLDGSLLVESLLEGPEYSVETLGLADGPTVAVGVTDKHVGRPPWFVETGHDFPSRAGADRQRALAAAAKQALAAVGLDLGPAHTELRWTADGPVVVEINPRLAGGMIPELVREATGVDLVGAWLDLLQGRPVALEPSRRRHAAVRFLLAPRAGRLAAVRGVDQAAALSAVRTVVVERDPGAVVRPPQDAYDRLGYVLGVADDPARLDRDLEAALAVMPITVTGAGDGEVTVGPVPAASAPPAGPGKRSEGMTRP
jgi:S-sulfo-L-cysteine synthase (3-phospho-L-serine-dependent)